MRGRVSCDGSMLGAGQPRGVHAAPRIDARCRESRDETVDHRHDDPEQMGESGPGTTCAAPHSSRPRMDRSIPGRRLIRVRRDCAGACGAVGATRVRRSVRSTSGGTRCGGSDERVIGRTSPARHRSGSSRSERKPCTGPVGCRGLSPRPGRRGRLSRGTWGAGPRRGTNPLAGRPDRHRSSGVPPRPPQGPRASMGSPVGPGIRPVERPAA